MSTEIEEKVDQVNEEEEAARASHALGIHLGELTKYIGRIAIKSIKDDFIDPFKEEMAEEIATIHEQQKSNESLFQSNVLEAVKRSRRQLIEERIQEFDTVELIKKLSEIPDATASNMLAEKGQRREVKLLKDSYEAERNNLITSAAQQGMVGGNTVDRDAISGLIEDRIRNTDTHGTVVSLTIKSTSKKDSNSILDCSNLNIERAAKVWENLQTQELFLEELTIEGVKLELQFKSLRAIASIINSMSA